MINRETFRFHLACSEDKNRAFVQITESFNNMSYHLEDGRVIELHAEFYSSEEVIRVGLTRDFPLICPGSTLWLHELQTQWDAYDQYYEQYQERAIVESHVFAASPVVLVLHPKRARQLGYPDCPIGWDTLYEAALQHQDLSLMHAHGQTGDGKLIAVAEFQAALSRGHSDPELFVRSLESMAREYGPTDQSVLARAWEDEEWRVDVIIAQERNILQALSEHPYINAILVYPHEGTIWADHPLALMSFWENSEQYQAFSRLRDHLQTTETGGILLQDGFHPTSSKDLGSIADSQRLYRVQAPVSRQRIQVVNNGAPPMVLPGINVTRTIGQQWGYAKKPADICLVVDVSDSMNNADKLPKVKEGIRAFLEKFQNPETTLTVISFNNRAHLDVAPVSILAQKTLIMKAIYGLSASGMTALLDAVQMAIGSLERQGDSSHIQTIITLTDGQENKSELSQKTVLDELKKHPDIVFYGIAYGRDADRELLDKMASVTKGLVVDSSPSNIQKLYEHLTTYV